MRQEAEIWQTYRGTIKTEGNTPKPKNVAPTGPIWGFSNAVFFIILAQIGKPRNIVYKEAL
jgi:hypothetical protein